MTPKANPLESGSEASNALLDAASPLLPASGALTRLLMIMDGADAAPTSDAQTAAEKWEAAGADALARWKSLQADIAAVNTLLQSAKLQPLSE